MNWFQTARFLTIYYFREKDSLWVKNVAVTQSWEFLWHFAACFWEKYYLLLILQLTLSVSIIYTWWMARQIFTFLVQVYLFFLTAFSKTFLTSKSSLFCEMLKKIWWFHFCDFLALFPSHLWSVKDPLSLSFISVVHVVQIHT